MPLTFLLTAEHRYTWENFLRTPWGKPWLETTTILSYTQVWEGSEVISPGICVFTDIERLSEAEANRAVQLWQHLAEQPDRYLLLNHPQRVLRRYSLLRLLYDRQFNHFNVYLLSDLRATQANPQRFPVFLRNSHDHQGSRTGLIYTPEFLDQVGDRLEQGGVNLQDILVEEFCDTRDRAGIFRKYSAFIVGDRVIPAHLLFGQFWLVKLAYLYNDNYFEEERIYMETNPHAEALRSIAKLACIDYGRVDYSLYQDSIQVWEINTNPYIGTGDQPGTELHERRKPFFEQQIDQLHKVFLTLELRVPTIQPEKPSEINCYITPSRRKS